MKSGWILKQLETCYKMHEITKTIRNKTNIYEMWNIEGGLSSHKETYAEKRKKFTNCNGQKSTFCGKMLNKGTLPTP